MSTKPKKQPKTEKRKEIQGDVPVGRIFLIAGVVFGIGIYYLYNAITSPPKMPEVDPNQYWGPYPMDAKQDTSVRPYKIEFPDAIINDLRERLLHRRQLPLPLEDTGSTYGFNSNFLAQVIDYWQNKYNFKEREALLNKHKHYITNIQGLDIHYLHAQPKTTEADVTVVPLLMLHGWPGSVREFYEVIELLTKPREDRNIVFEVIAPSLPGFGFSQGSSRPGFGPLEAAAVLHSLMRRAGRHRYYVQGGDYGHVLGSVLATMYPDSVLGFHTNTPVLLFNPMAVVYVWLGSFWPSMVEKQELQSRMYPLASHAAFLLEESGYLHLQATKPDTIGAALSDSPSGLAAYILEKFSTWTDAANRKAYDGNLLDNFSMTKLLDNLMIYWTTNSIVTSMRLYAETFNSRNIMGTFDRIPTEVPTWGLKFKHELLHQPDCVLKLKYKNYLQSTVVDSGGHFAAMENPAILADDLFQAVSTFRQYHGITDQPVPVPQTVYPFTVKDIYGNEVKLEKYKNMVLLIVNVASLCGLTDKNYKELKELHNKYHDKGLRILAFPCNQFKSQEPGSSRVILNFIKERGIEFDVFEKVDVNGENADPLWVFLKNTKGGTFGDFIKWNFSKFLVNRHGVPVERFNPYTDPLEIEPYIKKYL